MVISTTRTSCGRRARAFSYWDAEQNTVSGSCLTISFATSTSTAWAGLPPLRQVSWRSGQMRKSCLRGSNSAGMRKPSFLGVLSVMILMMRSLRSVGPDRFVWPHGRIVRSCGAAGQYPQAGRWKITRARQSALPGTPKVPFQVPRRYPKRQAVYGTMEPVAAKLRQGRAAGLWLS